MQTRTRRCGKCEFDYVELDVTPADAISTLLGQLYLRGLVFDAYKIGESLHGQYIDTVIISGAGLYKVTVDLEQDLWRAGLRFVCAAPDYMPLDNFVLGVPLPRSMPVRRHDINSLLTDEIL